SLLPGMGQCADAARGLLRSRRSRHPWLLRRETSRPRGVAWLRAAVARSCRDAIQPDQSPGHERNQSRGRRPHPGRRQYAGGALAFADERDCVVGPRLQPAAVGLLRAAGLRPAELRTADLRPTLLWSADLCPAAVSESVVLRTVLLRPAGLRLCTAGLCAGLRRAGLPAVVTRRAWRIAHSEQSEWRIGIRCPVLANCSWLIA